MSLKLKAYKSNNISSKSYGKYYPRVDYNKIMDLSGLAAHMHQHHSIYPEEDIKAVLEKACKCARELMLEGTPVKFDGLAIFKATVEGNGVNSVAEMSLLPGGSVKSVKMIAQATGIFTKKELTEECELEWNSEWKKKIQEAKKATQESSGDDDNNG